MMLSIFPLCRPVLAIVDIETLEIEEERREDVYAGVIDNQGPPDGTVILALADGDDFEDEIINKILETLSELGEIILVRWSADIVNFLIGREAGDNAFGRVCSSAVVYVFVSTLTFKAKRFTLSIKNFFF